MFSDKRIQIANGSDEDEAIDPATEATLASIAGFVSSAYDSITLTYTGDNLTGVVYKNGVTTVSTLVLAYNGSNQLTSVTKS